MKTLFLYRTQKKKRYFTKLANNSFKDTPVEIKSYNILCINRGLIGLLSRKTKKDLCPDLYENVNKALQEVFKERSFFGVQIVKKIYSRLITLKIYGLYIGLQKILKDNNQYNKIVIWNGLKYQDFVLKSVLKHSKDKLIFMENGFLPNTTFIGNKGINAGADIPKDKSFYKNLELKPTPDFQKIKGRAFKKEKLRSSAAKDYVLLPFQMERDSQILEYSPWVKNMTELFEQTKDALENSLLKEKTLVIREHPSTKTVYKNLYKQQTPKVMFDSQTAYNKALENSSVVVTVNSSVGFEAIIKGKTVIVLGEAFYNINGLCLSANNKEELTKAFDASKTFKMDTSLKDSFLSYLYNDVLIHGDWKNPSANHFTSFSKRFLDL